MSAAAFPTTPGDVPDAGFHALIDAYMGHLTRLVHAHHGVGEPVPAETLVRHSIAALACQHAVAERVLNTRWCTARDALTYGASIDDTAAAMGFDVDELVFGLARWADGQVREHRMTRAQHETVLTLVEDPKVAR